MPKGIRYCTVPPVLNIYGFLRRNRRFIFERANSKITKQDIEQKVLINYSKRYTVELDIWKTNRLMGSGGVSLVDEIDLLVVETYTLNFRIITSYKTYIHQETLVVEDTTPPTITWKWGMSSETDPSGSITWEDECTCASKNFSLEYGAKRKFYIAAYAKDLDEFRPVEDVSGSLALDTSTSPPPFEDNLGDISVWKLEEDDWYFSDGGAQRLSKKSDVDVSIYSTDAVGNSLTINITVNVVDTIPPAFYFNDVRIEPNTLSGLFKEKSSRDADKITDVFLKGLIKLYDIYPDETKGEEIVTYNVMVSGSQGSPITLPFYPLDSQYTITYSGADSIGNPAIEVSRTIFVTDEVAPVTWTAPLVEGGVEVWASNWEDERDNQLHGANYYISGGGSWGGASTIRYNAKNSLIETLAASPNANEHTVNILIPNILVADESGPISLHVTVLDTGANSDETERAIADLPDWTLDVPDIADNGLLPPAANDVKLAVAEIGYPRGEIVNLKGNLFYTIRNKTNKDAMSFEIKYTFSDNVEKHNSLEVTQQLEFIYEDVIPPDVAHLSPPSPLKIFFDPEDNSPVTVIDSATIPIPSFSTTDHGAVTIKNIELIDLDGGVVVSTDAGGPPEFVDDKNTAATADPVDTNGMITTTFGTFNMEIGVVAESEADFQWYRIPTVLYLAGSVKITVVDTSGNESSISFQVEFARRGSTELSCVVYGGYYSDDQHRAYCDGVNPGITFCGDYCHFFELDCHREIGDLHRAKEAPKHPDTTKVANNTPCGGGEGQYAGKARPSIANARW